MKALWPGGSDLLEARRWPGIDVQVQRLGHARCTAPATPWLRRR
jgi:hypothetical protein